MAMITTQLRRGSRLENPISVALSRVKARLRWMRWLRHGSRGVICAIVVSLFAVILSHLAALPDWLPLEAVIPIALILGAGVGTFTTFLSPISPMDAARHAEARLGLKERLSSALEFESAPRAALLPDVALLMRLQQEDAATYAQQLRAVDAVPLKLPWEARIALGGLGLLLLALILPNLPLFISPEQLIERKIVSKTGDKLESSARLIARQADSQHLEGSRHAAANIQRLGQHLSQGHLDKKQAMVEISKLTEQMRAEQQKAAQQNSASGAGGKSLAQAGQQLAQTLAGSASGGKNRAEGQSHGFNIPGANKAGGKQTGQDTQNNLSTPEMQKAAQSMQQNNSQELSEQLRQLASRVQSGKMSSKEQQQAGQDLQKLSDALKNTSMPETQRHAQAAAEAMQRGDRQTAVTEMRNAADAAERETHQQADEQAMSEARQSVEGAESEMAGANSPSDIDDDSPETEQGKGNSNKEGTGQGTGRSAAGGMGQGLPGSHGKHGSGKGNGGSGGGGMAGGKPGNTGEGSSPLKHLGKSDPNDPRNGKLYFGKPLNSGPSKTGPLRKVLANPNSPAGQTTSKVPYYDYVAPARKSAESAMDKEDIPPAYRSDVRKYFDSLQPTPAGH